jgi:hypothetical protein
MARPLTTQGRAISRLGSLPLRLITLSLGLLLQISSGEVSAQEGGPPEVRQLVTFKFQPGKSGEAIKVFREQALPLYELNDPMLSFRGFREVESPESLDLIVVSAFQGMAGMDRSNSSLAAAAAQAGASVGAIYGKIGALSVSHTDQFVEMVAPLMNGDPTERRLVALVSFQLLPGEGESFERLLADAVLPWEQAAGVPSATGRFLVSDGWHNLRFIGFDSLGDFHDYWTRASESGHGVIDQLTVRRKEIIMAPVPELSVR